MTQDKAQSEINGYSLNKGCNAVLSYLLASHWARREFVICGVVFLEKDMPFPTEHTVQLTFSRHAENVKQHRTLH